MELINEKNNPAEILKLVEFLEVYLPYMSTPIPTKINAGGCGIFAKHLYETLTQMGFEVGIFYINSKDQKDSVDYVVKNNKVNSSHDGVQHVLVKIADNIYVDCDGISREFQIAHSLPNKMLTGELPLKALDVFNENLGSWNSVFDRDCEKQIVERLAEMPKDFEKFKKGDTDFKMTDNVRFTVNTTKELKKLHNPISFLQGLLQED